jgi:hypothetical protein
MKRKRVVLCISAVIVIGLSFLATPVFATVIDLWDSFPNAQGQNGFYAYGYNGATYRQLTDSGDYWFNTPEQTPWWGGIPYMGRLGSPWIQMHPSSIPQCGYYWGPEDVVLGYDVSESATYDVSGQFWQRNGYTKTYIKKNDTELWYSYLYGGGVADYNLNDISLVSGDKIYFGISAAGSDANDWGTLRGNISWEPQVIPEPASLSLLGLGMLGLFFRRKK